MNAEDAKTDFYQSALLIILLPVAHRENSRDMPLISDSALARTKKNMYLVSVYPYLLLQKCLLNVSYSSHFASPVPQAFLLKACEEMNKTHSCLPFSILHLFAVFE